MLKNVQFFNAGYCLQNEFFTGTGTFRRRRFHAVFVSFEHPIHGRCLIDSGYGPRFLKITSSLPGRILKHLLPTPSKQSVFEPGFLTKLGIEPKKISHIFVSHYHADHIGGLSLFPYSKFICRPEPLRWLRSLSIVRQLHQGFLARLLPSNFASRSLPVEESQFAIDPSIHSKIPVLDFWNDGSVILMDLPGHAVGQTGYLLNTDQGQICYVADAFWDFDTFERGRKLPLPARFVQHSIRDYERTQSSLRELLMAAPMHMLACHCKKTQLHVANAY